MINDELLRDIFSNAYSRTDVKYNIYKDVSENLIEICMYMPDATKKDISVLEENGNVVVRYVPGDVAKPAFIEDWECDTVQYVKKEFEKSFRMPVNFKVSKCSFDKSVLHILLEGTKARSNNIEIL